MSARCQNCGYHLEPSETDRGHHGCLVCQRDAATEDRDKLLDALRERDRLRTTLEDYRACMKKGMPALVAERDRYRDACRKIARLTTERTCTKCDRARGIARNALARPTEDDE